MVTQVELVRGGPVARILLRGEKGIQILSAETRQRLLTVVEEVANADCSVVVFAAEGRTFIAGASIDELRTHDEHSALQDSRFGQRLMNAIESLPQTTIAAIHGACAGGGTELVLACDLRFAAEGAKIGLPETSIGVLPGWGGTVRATHLLGAAVARRLTLTGELISADEAWRVGLVDAVFAPESFAAEVEARVAQILTRGPQARRRAKHLLLQHAAGGADLTAQYDAEARAFAECYRTGEPHEGMSAFLEKRPPLWEGRSP
jgi:enoyl-CoA hydratase/carnithine racemase